MGWDILGKRRHEGGPAKMTQLLRRDGPSASTEESALIASKRGSRDMQRRQFIRSLTALGVLLVLVGIPAPLLTASSWRESANAAGVRWKVGIGGALPGTPALGADGTLLAPCLKWMPDAGDRRWFLPAENALLAIGRSGVVRWKLRGIVGPIAVDRYGFAYVVVNHRQLLKLDMYGRVVRRANLSSLTRRLLPPGEEFWPTEILVMASGVYLIGGSGRSDSRILLSISATLKLRWVTYVGPVGMPAGYSLTALPNGQVLVALLNGSVLAFDSRGRIRWALSFGNLAPPPENPACRPGRSGMVYVSLFNGHLSALDRFGEQRWFGEASTPRVGTHPPGEEPDPFDYHGPGRPVVEPDGSVTAMTGPLRVSHFTPTGRLVWSYDDLPAGFRFKLGPRLHGGSIVLQGYHRDKQEAWLFRLIGSRRLAYGIPAGEDEPQILCSRDGKTLYASGVWVGPKVFIVAYDPSRWPRV